jgi:hypothetical protein
MPAQRVRVCARAPGVRAWLTRCTTLIQQCTHSITHTRLWHQLHETARRRTRVCFQPKTNMRNVKVCRQREHLGTHIHVLV